jgi:ferredoxin
VRVILDQDKCVGSGQCVFAAPEVFGQREEDGVSVVLDQHPPAELADAVRDTELGCPSGAITVLDR